MNTDTITTARCCLLDADRDLAAVGAAVRYSAVADSLLVGDVADAVIRRVGMLRADLQALSQKLELLGALATAAQAAADDRLQHE
jgi:hypothetical protein